LKRKMLRWIVLWKKRRQAITHQLKWRLKNKTNLTFSSRLKLKELSAEKQF